jgi:hypothetical protein
MCCPRCSSFERKLVALPVLGAEREKLLLALLSPTMRDSSDNMLVYHGLCSTAMLNENPFCT